RRIDVAARDVAEEVRGAQQAQTEREGHPQHTDVEAEEMAEDHRARAPEDQDHRPDQLGHQDPCLPVHSLPPTSPSAAREDGCTPAWPSGGPSVPAWPTASRT